MIRFGFTDSSKTYVIPIAARALAIGTQSDWDTVAVTSSSYSGETLRVGVGSPLVVPRERLLVPPLTIVTVPTNSYGLSTYLELLVFDQNEPIIVPPKRAPRESTGSGTYTATPTTYDYMTHGRKKILVGITNTGAATLIFTASHIMGSPSAVFADPDCSAVNIAAGASLVRQFSDENSDFVGIGQAIRVSLSCATSTTATFAVKVSD